MLVYYYSLILIGILRMRTKIILVLTLVTSVCLAQQVKPGWINPLLRAQTYPESTHIIGFSSQFFNKIDDINTVQEKVKSLARTSLAESIHISIRSSSASNISNVNGDGKEEYSKSVITSSSLNTSGLKTEVYVDQRNNVVYGLAYVTKKKLLFSYFQELNKGMGALKEAFEHADLLKDKGLAYNSYLSILEDLQELKTIQEILITLGATSEAILKYEKWRLYHHLADGKAEELRNSQDISLMEAAHFLVDELIQELVDKSATIVLGLITYKNQPIGTELSERMRLFMLDDFNKKGINVAQSVNRGGVQYFLNGSYWPGKNKVQISAAIEEHHDAEVIRIMASGSVFVSKTSLDTDAIVYEPDDLQAALERTEIIEQNEIPDQGMTAEIWTNKSGEAQIYKEGDHLILSVRVNRPSYLRLLNLWNDGSKLLLLDNYEIREGQTNQVINLPFEWQTTCPCGIEHIQLFAQSEKFVELETRNEGDFIFIEESLRSIMDKSRGFVKRKGKGYFSEQRLTVTTLKK